MAEIIRPQFGKKPQEGEAPVPKEKAQDTNTVVLSDVEYLEEHRDLVSAATHISTDFSKFLESLEPGSASQQNVDIRLQGLKEKTLEDLCTIWLTSRETDWKRNPSFYAAVVIQFSSKVRATIADSET